MTGSEPNPEMSQADKLDIIRSHFDQEATVYKAAGYVLRTSMDLDERTQALEDRYTRFTRCTQLIDAYLDIRDEV